MKALETDLITLFLLVDVTQHMIDTAQHECKLRNLNNLFNRLNKLKNACDSYCLNFAANLPPESANELRKLRKSEDTLDALTLLEYFMLLPEDKRDMVRNLLFAARDNKTVTFTISDNEPTPIH